MDGQLNSNVMKPTIFVGIDISKLTLDVAVIKDGGLVLTKKIKNSVNDITEFLGKMKTEYSATRGKTVYCAKQMGIYAKFIKEDFPRNALGFASNRHCKSGYR